MSKGIVQHFMQLRILLLLAAFLPVVYDAWKLRIIDRKRQEPLPEEVRDVYTEERWKTFVAHKHDLRVPHLIGQGWSFLLDCVMILTPFFLLIENWSHGNIYLAVAIAVFLMTVIPLLVSVPLDWYRCFKIDEKYGLNRRTTAEFVKDQLVDTIGGFVLTLLLYELLAFILLHLRSWTHGFSIPALHGLLLTAGIAAVLIIFMYGASWIAWRLMRMRYVFTPLEEGDLKNRILTLIKDSRHPVKRIEVYNESSKSTSKNAFVLKLPFYRSIGIADNFLNENAEEELLGVLAHEAGHLKHRPDIRNILTWIMGGLAFVIAAAGILHGEYIAGIERAFEQAFGLSRMNPVLSISIAGWLLTPLLFPFMVFRNYTSRCEEYEADRNAVSEGYGEPLIKTFKELSNDELVDVNPADVIEFLEYDHPGMYHRICAIRKAIASQG